MSRAATARIVGAPGGSDPDAGEVFRLLAPHGSSGDRVRIVDLPLPWPSLASRKIANLGETDLLVVRTWTPRATQRILRRRGVLAHVYVLAPSVDRARVATSLLRRPIRGCRGLRDVVVSLSARLRAREVVGRRAEVVVLVTREAPPAQWIADLCELGGGPTTVAARLSWRGRGGGATVLVSEGPDPTRFVKVAFDEVRAERLRHEHASLAEIAAAAGGAIAVPGARALVNLDGLTFLVEDAVEGRVAAGLPPAELEPLFERLAAWLVAWHGRTLVAASGLGASGEVLEIARALDTGPAYEQWLRDARPALPTPNARVAVHGDLTMWNVLSARAGAIGVVDWEDATPHGPPLSDLLYAAVDAELVCGAHEHRLQAFDAVFSAHPTTIGMTCRRAADRLGLDAATARYAFHETWLRHAANQMVRDDGSEFSEIVHRRLTVHPERYPWAAGA